MGGFCFGWYHQGPGGGGVCWRCSTPALPPPPCTPTPPLGSWNAALQNTDPKHPPPPHKAPPIPKGRRGVAFDDFSGCAIPGCSLLLLCHSRSVNANTPQRGRPHSTPNLKNAHPPKPPQRALQGCRKCPPRNPKTGLWGAPPKAPAGIAGGRKTPSNRPPNPPPVFRGAFQLQPVLWTICQTSTGRGGDANPTSPKPTESRPPKPPRGQPHNPTAKAPPIPEPVSRGAAPVAARCGVRRQPVPTSRDGRVRRLPKTFEPTKPRGAMGGGCVPGRGTHLHRRLPDTRRGGDAGKPLQKPKPLEPGTVPKGGGAAGSRPVVRGTSTPTDRDRGGDAKAPTPEPENARPPKPRQALPAAAKPHSNRPRKPCTGF
jgi:hypothetical protein